MKLLRLKITDPEGFRSLQSGFELRFRNEYDWQERVFAPFVCAGPNGSGKSNLLELLAAIFFHMECTYLENRPDSFDFDEQANPNGFRSEKAVPNGFEIEYLIKRPNELAVKEELIRVQITKLPEEAPQWSLWNTALNNWEKLEELEKRENLSIGRALRQALIPDYILGYSSGENEILSLPFFKMRFVQFDEYREALKKQLLYSGRPESRLIFLDSGFSQAILLCNLLFQKDDALKPFREDVKIDELKEFRIIIRQSIPLSPDQLDTFDFASFEQRKERENKLRAKNPGLSGLKIKSLIYQDIVNNNGALSYEDEGDESLSFRLNLMHLLEGNEKSMLTLSALKRCATCWFVDETTDTLYLDYHVNKATREAFSSNFDGNPIKLFHALQVLLTLNLFSVNENLKKDLYQSGSLYASETVPVLPSDERIMRFKNFWVTKTEVDKPVLLKSFSDGEHQLLHTLGLCLLFKDTQSLFLLDEPETHFNPDWRANFVTRLHESFNGSSQHDMLITTHTPFLISDSQREKVLVFEKTDGVVTVKRPEYNTLGASINKITMTTFRKKETIGLRAQTIIDSFKERLKNESVDKERLIESINLQLGDSVEKILLVNSIIESMEEHE